jgi:hypothetical protein
LIVGDRVGQEPVADGFELERPGRAGDANRVGGEIKEHVAPG